MLPFLPASFGDIVAAANIALSIYQALNDSTGASHDYRCLTSEIRSLEHALRAVEHAISANPPSETLTENIKAETKTCLALLEKLQDDIKSYQKLSAGGKRAFWRKIGWVLCKVDKVAKFREELARRNQNIMLFLTILSVTSTRADKANRSLMSIGYGNSNSVTVINAFGNPMTFPLELCFSPEKFHDTLMSYFKGKCGEGHVDRHDYSISTKDGRTFAESNNWGSVVKKGRVLVMSMIVMKVTLCREGTRRQGNICPRCYETVGVMPDDGWFQCRRCERRIVVEDGTLYLMDPPTRDTSVTEFRNIRVVLVEPSPSPSRRRWHNAIEEEANRFVEIS